MILKRTHRDRALGSWGGTVFGVDGVVLLWFDLIPYLGYHS